MRYPDFVDFGRGMSVFANFSYGIYSLIIIHYCEKTNKRT